MTHRRTEKLALVCPAFGLALLCSAAAAAPFTATSPSGPNLDADAPIIPLLKTDEFDRVHTDVPEMPRLVLDPPLERPLIPELIPGLDWSLPPIIRPGWNLLNEDRVWSKPDKPEVMHTDLPDLPDKFDPGKNHSLASDAPDVYKPTDFDRNDYTLRSVPAPGSVTVLGLSLLALQGRRRRR